MRGNRPFAGAVRRRTRGARSGTLKRAAQERMDTLVQ